ncbi:MAG: TOBE domain-containing protein, partial [Chloroflexia bacterium]|nr:TOBE domain-containing protein [Chloroflexia bacterium]
ASGHVAETEIGRLELTDPRTGAVEVLLRPECVTLTATTDDDPAAGLVVRREYFGRYQALTVRLRSGATIKATSGPEAGLSVGTTVRVSTRMPSVAFGANGSR